VNVVLITAGTRGIPAVPITVQASMPILAFFGRALLKDNVSGVLLCSTGEIRQASIDLLAVDGAEFKLLCPNSETVARIVAAFLDGLRRRSRWAVALDQSVTQTRPGLTRAVFNGAGG